MEHSGRRLGWIAIGIGVLALMVALFRGPGGYTAPRFADQAGPQAPQVQPFEERGPRGEFGSRDRMWAQMEEERGFVERGGHGWRGHGFFFWPFMLLGGLFKLALFGLLIFLGLKLLRRGRHGGSGGPPRDETRDPPATGQTTSL